MIAARVSAGRALPLQISNAYGVPYGMSRAFEADPFPPRRFVKFTYGQLISLSNGAAGVYGTGQTFRLNSLFDPDLTGVGHQPYGYDQVSLVYQKFKTFRAEVEVTFLNQSASLLCGLEVLGPDDTAVLAGVAPEYPLERPTGECLPLPGAYLSPTRFRKIIDMHQVIGMSKLAFDADLDGTCHQVGANPLRPVTFKIAVAEPTGTLGQGAVTVQAMVRITYHAMCWSRETQAQS